MLGWDTVVTVGETQLGCARHSTRQATRLAQEAKAISLSLGRWHTSRQRAAV